MMILLMGIPLGPISQNDPAVPVLRNLPQRPPWFTSLCARLFGRKEVAKVCGVLLTYHLWRRTRYLTGFEYLGTYAHDTYEDCLTLEPDKKHFVLAPSNYVYRNWVSLQRFVKHPHYITKAHQLAGYKGDGCVIHVLAGGEYNPAYNSGPFEMLWRRGAEIRRYTEDNKLIQTM